jgi:hypothetical protein
MSLIRPNRLQTSFGDTLEQHKSTALTLTSKLLTLPTQPALEQCNKALLSMLFPTRAAFFSHKDSTLLRHVVRSIHEHEDTDKGSILQNSVSAGHLSDEF